MTQRLATGRIVWAEIADANGIRKLRPAVIVTPTELAQIHESDIQDTAGFVPSAVMTVILDKVAAVLRPPPPPADRDGPSAGGTTADPPAAPES